LRAYCNQIQNNWSTLLPIAELAYNTHTHAATKKTPFELLYGYNPIWPSELKVDEKVPTAEQRISTLEEAQKEALATMRIADESMKQQHDTYGKKGPNFQPGNKVWLEGKNLRTQYPSAKLAPKRYGPFDIIGQIGQGAYKLRLPNHMKIHPVFHAGLLSLYKETEAHGPRSGSSGNILSNGKGILTWTIHGNHSHISNNPMTLSKNGMTQIQSNQDRQSSNCV
jgi:hypothetical protein